MSIAGAGFSAYGDILKGQGIAAGDTFKASILEEQAKRGELAAVQTGAGLTRKLATDMGNIDAIRASVHADPTSPTGGAIRSTFEQTALTNKSIAVDNITAQARQEQAEAEYLKGAAKQALLAGEVSAGADILKALGQASGGGGGADLATVAAG